MRVDSKIEALRSDPASQRKLRAAVADKQAEWRRRTEVDGVLRDLAKFGRGASLAELPNLRRLTDDHSFAAKWVDEWAMHWTKCLRDNPLASMPMRHHRGDAFSSVQIEASGRAVLSLAVYEQHEQELEPASVILRDIEQHEIILAGSAKGLLHTVSGGQGNIVRWESTPMDWMSGDTITSDAQKSWRHVLQADGQMLVLQLLRGSKGPAPTREYCLKSGALLRQSSGEKSASQHELAMAVLAAMQRKDAAPVIANLSQSGPDHRRWEAVRQALGLDPVTGFDALRKIAESETDSLRDHARIVQAQLTESHPQLAALERKDDALCPA